MQIVLSRTSFCRGSITLPGDKSISHRSLIFGAIAQGKTRVQGLLHSEDVLSTWRCLEKLGISINQENHSIIIKGLGDSFFSTPTSPLDCGNSGTTARLLMGLLSGYPLTAEFIGDPSLSQRPMKRIAIPLREMGAHIELTQEQKLPLLLKGTHSLKNIHYKLPVASAQLKSAILLAGLRAKGTTVLSGETLSRDHTERMLQYFGAQIKFSNSNEHALQAPILSLQGEQKLEARDIHVPGDISSAAFWIALALLTPGSHLEIENVLLNPSRLGLIHILERMGAKIHVELTALEPEPVGVLTVRYSELTGTEILPHEIPTLIDEIPILSLIACHAQGVTLLRGAEELRVKETDRLEAITHHLRKMGARIESFPDGFEIEGPQHLHGAELDSLGDHRIAMTFSIAGLLASGETIIREAECVSISYPEFYDTLKILTQKS